MRRIAVMFAVSLAACATGHSGTEQPSSESLRIVGSGGSNLRMAPSEGARVSTIAVPIDRAWSALPAIYDSLGIMTDNVDPARKVVGHSGMKLHRQLGKILLTKIIDCGSTQGFPSADSYEIQFSVFTQLASEESGKTKVSTMVTAVGRPMAFAGEFVKCSSKGVLESTISDAVTTWSAKPK
jgi:hypothetical protein